MPAEKVDIMNVDDWDSRDIAIVALPLTKR